jgi:NDP-sugar pyrophosphorylase family protein
LRANLDLLGGNVPLQRFRPSADPFAGTLEVAPGVHADPKAVIDPSATLTGPALVHAGAVIGPRAQIGPNAVVGAGVRVDAGAAVVRAVCWAGTHVAPGERVQDAIASPGVRLEC